MSKKNVKVIEITSRLNNGNLRTVHAIAPLEATFDDVCRMKNIPMLSIISKKVTGPMKTIEAIDYTASKAHELFTAPDNILIRSTFSIDVA